LKIIFSKTTGFLISRAMVKMAVRGRERAAQGSGVGLAAEEITFRLRVLQTMQQRRSARLTGRSPVCAAESTAFRWNLGPED
jgi:hypothetical protein